MMDCGKHQCVTTVLQAAAMLLQMQLLLSEDATGAFEAAHAATAAGLAALQLPPPLAAQLQLHCAALHALYLLRRGRINELSAPGEAEGTSVPHSVHGWCMREQRCCAAWSGGQAAACKVALLGQQHMERQSAFMHMAMKVFQEVLCSWEVAMCRLGTGAAAGHGPGLSVAGGSAAAPAGGGRCRGPPLAT
jgi:hypothetical protein